ncbi:MAG TPA: nuclear transport factor 2 family protein, partial [Candidatus Acidoferrales bacterium]|nr:nuclear transport factor 2 family protein [Candidatus Acidoferrales bacterium]
MKKIITLSAAIFFVAGIGAASTPAHAGASDDAEIKALEARFAKALEAKDVDAIMANYVPGDSLVVFDIIPPRQYTGWDAYKKDWAGVVAGCADTPKMELSDLEIASDKKLAYSHSIQHFVCTDSKGVKLEMTMRATDVYRKVDGKWLIAHEHLSAP